MSARLRSPGGLRWPSATAWLALLLPVFAWAPLAYPGYFQLHSGFLPVFNLSDLFRHLADPAWAPTIGQPYDLLRGERSLPYLLAVLPRALGLPSVTAVKLLFGFSLLAGAVGMYGWTRQRLGRWPALLAAGVYVYWPLGLATLYVRGALAEALLLGIMPFLWWAAEESLGHNAARDSRQDASPEVLVAEARQAEAVSRLRLGRWTASAGLGLALAAALWTQTGLSLWLAALALAYLLLACFAAPGSRSRVLPGLIGWLGGLALGTAGLAPLLLRRGLGETGLRVAMGWVVFTDHFVYPHQLLLSGWGPGPSIAGPGDSLTFQLGLAACGLAALSILHSRLEAHVTTLEAAHAPRDAQCALRDTRSLALAFVALLALLATTLASPLWRLLPSLAHTLTYPWQLLLLTGPWLAWLAALGGRALQRLLPETHQAAGAAPLFAALLALALLGVYGSVDPPATDLAVTEEPLGIFGGGEIALLSASAAGTPGPGGAITLDVQWQALRPLNRDYTVFFHVVGPDGTRWGQQDTMPQDNRFPTSQWRPGQVVTDRYRVTLKEDAPAGGDYRYLVGLYFWQTGERLPTAGDDKVTLAP